MTKIITILVIIATRVLGLVISPIISIIDIILLIDHGMHYDHGHESQEVKASSGMAKTDK